MGISLTILKVGKLELDDLIDQNGGILIVPRQESLHPWGAGDNLPHPTSEIKKDKKTTVTRHYKIKHHSETKKNQVRAFFNDFAPVIRTADSYQETATFRMVYNLRDGELYLFAVDNVCTSFINRMGDLKERFNVERLDFNLYKVATSSELKNVGGIWTKNPSGGRVKAKAIFGRDVHKSGEANPEDYTAINVEIMLSEEEKVYIIISKDGMISSPNSTVTEGHLLGLYERLKPLLLDSIISPTTTNRNPATPQSFLG